VVSERIQQWLIEVIGRAANPQHQLRGTCSPQKDRKKFAVERVGAISILKSKCNAPWRHQRHISDQEISEPVSQSGCPSRRVSFIGKSE
jgi:hypothetical protein